MFFFLSKILSFLLSPFTYLVVLLIWMFFCRNHRRQKKILLFTIGFVFFFGNSFILDEFLRLWEVPVNESRNKNYDIGIVLSGMVMYDAKNNVSKFNGNVDRLLQTLPKLKKKEINHLVVSGGSGDLYHPENKEAHILKSYLLSIGWNIDNFTFESESRNTFENAKYTVEVLKKKHIDLKEKKILLITSSGHMRRSIACFEKQGIKVDYLCSNRHSGPRKFEFQHCFIPNMSAFNGWSHLLHEVAGYTVYKLTGKI
ncbi:MAG: hypothetical protein CMP67_10540 [Flavobacteriales bacterium]|nr:hypothetical protein [Flavobacteriales bacterium]|tara:strand:+ start:12409 stop:13176 length:768 start_codon:yes stop_codon:yes gene_type:complete